MREIARRRVLPVITVAALALPIAGQVARPRTSVATETHVRTGTAPYTAEYKIERVQTLADGTTITKDTTQIKALDSQGRRMTATTDTSEEAGRAPVTHVMVYDPVAHTQAHWNSPGSRATVTSLTTPGEAYGCSTIMADSDAVRVTGGAHFTSDTENLGMASIQGIEARGRRITTAIPAGAVGNDAPLVSTKEIWSATTAGLNGLVVRDITDDPRSGKLTRELTNLTQGDPDPSIFQPPAGYEIVTREAATCQGEPTPTTNRTSPPPSPSN